MLNLTVHGQTDIGLVRKTNEDAFSIVDLTTGDAIEGGSALGFPVGERGVLLAVSDGMGGAAAGEVASAMVLESVRRSMMAPANSRSASAVEEATERANLAVWTAARQEGRKGMGATLTALHVHGSVVDIAEVGDSRAYLLRGGSLVQVTRDQSYIQLLIDTGKLTAEQAANSPMQHVISQAMGHKAAISVALGRLELRQRDCLLLCSDGLSNEVSAAEIRQLILEAPGLDVACVRLIALAKQRGGRDNVTVLLAGVSGDLQPLRVGETGDDALQIIKEAPTPSLV
jgi:serine/threonine protein phosphatase PrpC